MASEPNGFKIVISIPKGYAYCSNNNEESTFETI